jgi:aspartate ammonia-lyase
MRIEKDLLGEKEVPDDALYGIHSMRARENFPSSTVFNKEWFKAMASVKRACYITAEDFYTKAAGQIDLKGTAIRFIDAQVLKALISAATDCESGSYFSDFIVPAVSGGAGTSINMNMNEIIANVALISLGDKPGHYTRIDPVEHANIFQSTNDVVPTAFKVAIMRLLLKLESVISNLRTQIENKEKQYRNTLRMGYTQMQEAVPTTFGRLFSTYSDMFSRDWWRISKCNERIKVVNLGGSAIGTSVTVPRYFVAEVVRVLQQITDLPVTRGENLSDATSNLDSLVEVHAVLKAHAVNLEKMVNDLRLLASDISVGKVVQLPRKQAGSSIMPAKVNPVIPEFVISSCHKVYSNDMLVSGLSGQGCLELNAYIPVIGHVMLESLELLIACDRTLSENMITDLHLEAGTADEMILNSPTMATLLLPYIGYNRSVDLANYMRSHKLDIISANKKLKLMADEKLAEILKPGNIISGGFSIKDLMNDA